MILIDTSVWVDHLRRGNRVLATLLDQEDVLCHPFVVGELACGNLQNRRKILRHLNALPSAPLAEHHEVLHFIEQENLYGRGLGLIDIHLLASAQLKNCLLWTRDKALATAADDFSLAFEP